MQPVISLPTKKTKRIRIKERGQRGDAGDIVILPLANPDVTRMRRTDSVPLGDVTDLGHGGNSQNTHK